MEELLKGMQKNLDDFKKKEGDYEAEGFSSEDEEEEEDDERE